MLADMYGWSLQHIFEYVTYKDVDELMKYAKPRRERTQNFMFRTYGYIMRAANFYEQGGDKQFRELMSEFEDPDHSYLNAKLDVNGLKNLAATVAANRRTIAANRA